MFWVLFREDDIENMTYKNFAHILESVCVLADTY